MRLLGTMSRDKEVAGDSSPVVEGVSTLGVV